MEREVFQVPEFCPACSGPTSVEGEFLYCRSKVCPSRLSGTVRVWVNKLGLLHWGDAFIDALTDPDKPRVSSLADLYRLTVEEMAECCSGMKVAMKCWETLHKAKKIPLELMLAGLNIPNLGIATGTDMVQSGLNSVEKILAADHSRLLEVPNVGEVTARQIYLGLQDRRDMILDLASVLEIKDPTSGPLSGKSFCITGATSKPRKAVQKEILEAGGIVKESVGAGLTYLVTNEDPSFNSSKMQKAKKLGTQVISESDLYRMFR
jgi:DNA ligase (NAD+)